MGHLQEAKGVYLELRERLDKTQAGLAETAELYEILKYLYTEEEARLASQLPLTPRRVSVIAKKLNQPEAEVQIKLEKMAKKGLVFDFVHPRKGGYFMLAPAVIGFFEMTMMRKRTDIDQKALAPLLSKYMFDKPDFMEEVSRSGTPLGRVLVNEETIRPEFTSDVLSYERATAIVEESDLIGVALCYCRHKKEHLGENCEAPMDVCLAFGKGAEFMIRREFSREISREEALDKIRISRENDMVQVADNVKNEPTYICNCCGCCCGQLGAINRFGLDHSMGTSNFIASIDSDHCIGCGKCSKSCPIQAIVLRARPYHKRANTKGKRFAQIDESICLGCSVCVPKCKNGALTMEPRKKRVLTPEDTMERVLGMAMGRGHLHNVLFDTHDGPTAEFLNKLAGAIERMPLTKRLAVNNELKSRFVGFLCDKVRKSGKAKQSGLE